MRFSANICRLFVVIFSLLASSTELEAVEILAVEVKSKGGIYTLYGESLIEAPANVIFGILLDYDNFHRLASGIAETSFLPVRDYGVLIGYTRINTCVWFYCRKVEKVDRIQAIAPEEIRTDAIPAESDFRMNRAKWSLENVAGGTRVIYKAEIEPDFWMPPLIGTWAIKRKLRRSAEEIGDRIEYLAATGRNISTLAVVP